MGAGDRVVVVAWLTLSVGCSGLFAAFSDDEGETDIVSVDSDDGDGSFVGGSSAGGSSASGARGGASGTGATACEQQPLSWFDTGCDNAGMLREYCAQGGCHNATSAAGGLDLTPDNWFVARTLNVPARMGVANNGVTCIPAPCPTPGSTLLIDSNHPGSSFMLRKMEGFVPGSGMDVDIGCGTAMPMWATTATSGYGESARWCLENLFHAIAASGEACALFGQGPVQPLPLCP